ncbi:hypothetical protein P9160_08805 [Bacillus halotolerans]|uniref:ABC-three component system middle component 2 n=1 Tax=Bacillus halotolerans TaxID=260554 RepID=UPI002DBEC86F|nr:ABC-three component system middle component 2 [Bacillus halotolerans]MEC3757461.1 hypothetical protein [Bacillus halotolerans]
MSNYKVNDSANSFNSPFEVGLRMLIILAVTPQEKFDLQRLIYYDYLVLHTNDVGVESSPVSIHPDTPNRSGEIIVRRQVMQQGLKLMNSKNLLIIIYDENGISYSSSVLTQPFLDLFESDYYRKLKKNALWVTRYFSGYSETELKSFVEKNIGNWGGEFMYEAFIRSVAD